MTLFIPSPNYAPGRAQALRWVIWHSTEGGEVAGAAQALARNWFGVATSRVSAHVVADATEVVECVKPDDTAWHCGRYGNAPGYGVEVVGRAAQTVESWRDGYSLAALDNAADWVRGCCALGHIPERWLTDEQVKAGELGHVTHAQISRVLGGSTHTDPGVNFPHDYVMSRLRGTATAPLPEAVDPSTFPVLHYRDTDPGATGPVRTYQGFMTRVFGSYNPYSPTGYFGDLTLAGTQEFQRRTGLDTDGIVGPATNAKLAEYGYRA